MEQTIRTGFSMLMSNPNWIHCKTCSKTTYLTTILFAYKNSKLNINEHIRIFQRQGDAKLSTGSTRVAEINATNVNNDG